MNFKKYIRRLTRARHVLRRCKDGLDQRYYQNREPRNFKDQELFGGDVSAEMEYTIQDCVFKSV